MIRTVLGDVNPQTLGITYCHEHIIMDLSPVRLEQDSVLSDGPEMESELQLAQRHGVASVIEVTNIGMGRNAILLQEIARNLQLHIICSTGFYKEEYYPSYIARKSPAEIGALMAREIQTGIGDTNIRAGIIGEIGSSYNKITPLERKVFEGAAMAHLATGAPISTHCEMGTMATEQTEILLGYGVQADKIILGHMDLNTDLQRAHTVLRQGVTIAFDTIGKNRYRSNAERVQDLLALLSEGYGDQIVLSQDLTRKSNLKKNGGQGYTYLFDEFIPALQQQGIQSSDLNKMLIDNPARILNVFGK